MVGSYFPTGAQSRRGVWLPCAAARGGEFDPEKHKAAWPSTGNYCRGGAFDCAVLGCTSIAILPQGMSRERFEWLKKIGAEIIATPGCESNVKEIYDKCWELKRDPTNVIFNQFEEFGNPIFHYNVTGPAMESLPRSGDSTGHRLCKPRARGHRRCRRLLNKFPGLRSSPPRRCNADAADERLRRPPHRGYRRKHVPWVHNVRSTDAVAAVDDELLRILRLFEPARRPSSPPSAWLPRIEQLDLLGINGICNLLAPSGREVLELDERRGVHDLHGFRGHVPLRLEEPPPSAAPSPP